jgi:putative transposase
MERTFFITSVTAQRRTLFQCATTADLLLDVFLHYREQRKYQLHEFVVMPDHFHALITPAPEISLERAAQFVKGGFSFRLKSLYPVWQASFTNHRIRDDEDFKQHREYIRMNPVRAGLVRKPEQYPYSSATGRFILDAVPPGLKPDLDRRPIAPAARATVEERPFRAASSPSSMRPSGPAIARAGDLRFR